MECFGERLRRLRTERGMSTRALGERVGKTASEISAMERYTGEKKYETICQLAKALNVTTDELLGMTESEPATARTAAYYKNIDRTKTALRRLLEVLEEIG